jgi:hypothetical protein
LATAILLPPFFCPIRLFSNCGGRCFWSASDLSPLSFSILHRGFMDALSTGVSTSQVHPPDDDLEPSATGWSELSANRFIPLVSRRARCGQLKNWAEEWGQKNENLHWQLPFFCPIPLSHSTIFRLRRALFLECERPVAAFFFYPAPWIPGGVVYWSFNISSSPAWR